MPSLPRDGGGPDPAPAAVVGRVVAAVVVVGIVVTISVSVSQLLTKQTPTILVPGAPPASDPRAALDLGGTAPQRPLSSSSLPSPNYLSWLHSAAGQQQ